MNNELGEGAYVRWARRVWAAVAVVVVVFISVGVLSGGRAYGENTQLSTSTSPFGVACVSWTSAFASSEDSVLSLPAAASSTSWVYVYSKCAIRMESGNSTHNNGLTAIAAGLNSCGAMFVSCAASAGSPTLYVGEQTPGTYGAYPCTSTGSYSKLVRWGDLHYHQGTVAIASSGEGMADDTFVIEAKCRRASGNAVSYSPNGNMALYYPWMQTYQWTGPSGSVGPRGVSNSCGEATTAAAQFTVCYGPGDATSGDFMTSNDFYPDYWAESAPPQPLCESLESIDLAVKPLVGEDAGTWLELDNAGGYTLNKGARVRFTIDADGSESLQFMVFWNPGNRNAVYLNGGLPVTAYPFTSAEFQFPGPPQDAGAITVACYDVDDEGSGFFNLADQSLSTELPNRRACLNIVWTWPEDLGNRFLTDRDYAFFLEFPPDSESFTNAHSGEVLNIWFDADDGENLLETIYAVDSSSWEAEITTLYRVDGTTETLPYDPGSLEDFYVSLDFDDSPDLDPSRTGFWCNDDSGLPPVLYRLDSTYEAIEPGSPVGTNPSTPGGAGCFSFASMSLTSPSSWVRGIGNMFVCIGRWMFVPSDFGGWIDEQQEALGDEPPISFAVDGFALVSDMAGAAPSVDCFGALDGPGSLNSSSVCASLTASGLETTSGQRTVMLSIMIACTVVLGLISFVWMLS